jgi:tetratricopeptide (TPR) repeat protein
VALSLGLVLCGAGWATYLGQALQQAAARLQGAADLNNGQRQLAYLREAVRRNPARAQYQVELAQAYSEVFERENARLGRREFVRASAQLALDSAATPGVPAIATWTLAGDLRADRRQAAEEALADTYLVPAVQAFLRARAACPLLPQPHLALATHFDYLKEAEPRDRYWGRAKAVAPADPQVWYTCGVQELPANPAEAFASWRHCLELSDRYLPDIVTRVQAGAPERPLDTLLPDKPSLFLDAALLMYPDPADVAKRRPLLTRALLLLEPPRVRPHGEDHRTAARIYAQLDRKGEAIAAYRKALSLEPKQLIWRYELAQLLLEGEHAREARRELLLILDQQPHDSAARALLNVAARQIAEKG